MINILSDLVEKIKYVALRRRAEDGEKVAEIEESWKSYTCFFSQQIT